MDSKINPFQELYVTETIGSDKFVKLFSPVFVDNALGVFQAGNVVLKGVRGSGKSMVLRLLKPETRIAYKKAGIPFPIPIQLQKFISAEINITTCGIMSIGQRSFEVGKDEQEILPLYFADYFNYWLASELLKNIITIFNSGVRLAEDLGINCVTDAKNKFACLVAKDSCWFGYLDGVTTFDELVSKVDSRISAYLSFHNHNIDAFPDSIIGTKTSIGVPIATLVRCLRETDVLPPDLNVFVVIDQYEDLTKTHSIKSDIGILFRQMINKAIGQRNPFISYRIGSRRYAWKYEPGVYGTEAVLEEERDYKVIDLDESFRRKESTRDWIFPTFAEDVFKRRLKNIGYVNENSEVSLKTYFGTGLSNKKEAKIYAGENSPQRVAELEEQWPTHWKSFLLELVKDDPFSEKLAEAWARQKQKNNIVNEENIPHPYPWEQKQYWVKERARQVLMQIAGRSGQRLIWAGKNDILALSGGNILVFCSICQNIWNVWIRDSKQKRDSSDDSNLIDHEIQAAGIYEASNHWFDNILTEAGGNHRQKFIRFLGVMFYKKLYNDKAMTYPGHNGFSVNLQDLDNDMDIKKYLEDAVDYGDLHESEHTTRSGDKIKRKKWYLKPIYSSYFRLPDTHTKEPWYVNASDVRQWLVECNVFEGIKGKHPASKASASDDQFSLFS